MQSLNAKQKAVATLAIIVLFKIAKAIKHKRTIAKSLLIAKKKQQLRQA